MLEQLLTIVGFLPSGRCRVEQIQSPSLRSLVFNISMDNMSRGMRMAEETERSARRGRGTVLEVLLVIQTPSSNPWLRSTHECADVIPRRVSLTDIRAISSRTAHAG